MAGLIVFEKDRGRYKVNWYHGPHKKTYPIRKYKGEYLYHPRVAQKLLARMQSDIEDGIFRIEKYTEEVPTDIIPYLWEWLDAVAPTLSPATCKDYKNSIKNYLVPFFKRYPVQLHEIQLDVLTRLLGSINRKGKGKMNVMYCLHACLDYAWRSRKIEVVPPFPKKRDYGIVEPIIRWLPEVRQMAVIEAIPKEHQPIFWWLKYHLRRPSEAMALHKEDFDGEVFTIQRGVSGGQFVDRTKTGETHIIPCHADFKPIAKAMPKTFGPYFFTNPAGRLWGSPYLWHTLSRIWKTACAKVGEDITLYPGTKHSGATQLVVEHGYNLHDVQIATDHARLESVKRYAKVEVSARKAILERRKIVPLVQTKSKGGISD